MHAKSGLRVFLKWKIYRPDSVIAEVIQTEVSNSTICTLRRVKASNTHPPNEMQVDQPPNHL